MKHHSWNTCRQCKYNKFSSTPNYTSFLFIFSQHICRIHFIFFLSLIYDLMLRSSLEAGLLIPEIGQHHEHSHLWYLRYKVINHALTLLDDEQAISQALTPSDDGQAISHALTPLDDRQAISHFSYSFRWQAGNKPCTYPFRWWGGAAWGKRTLFSFLF